MSMVFICRMEETDGEEDNAQNILNVFEPDLFLSWRLPECWRVYAHG